MFSSTPTLQGTYNSDLIYDSGELKLVYNDGRGNCHHKYNRTTVILFTCDQGNDGAAGPRYLEEQYVFVCDVFVCLFGFLCWLLFPLIQGEVNMNKGRFMKETVGSWNQRINNR